VTQVGSASTPLLHVVLAGPHLPRSAEAAARSTLARLLGLDLDLSGFYIRAARDRLLTELAQRYRGLKPPRFPSVFECLLNAVACQQLSIAAGLTMLSRLAAAAGEPVGTLHAFPTPSDILGLPPSALRSLGFSERKAETILGLARAAAAGKLELETFEKLDDAAVVEALVRQPGIGRWSADYVLLRGLGRLNIFPQNDIGALSGLRAYLIDSGREEGTHEALVRWARDAGLVYFHLLLRSLEGQATGSRIHASESEPA
jgi:DNA-3-methyladenine glycosylase II